jgi:VanZ family protein
MMREFTEDWRRSRYALDDTGERMFEKYELRWTTMWLTIGWLLVVTVIVLSLVRYGGDPRPHGDKGGHILAYATLMFWFAQIYARGRTRLVIAAGLALMGVALEIAQGFTGYRSFEYADMAANTIGVAIGWLIATPRTANLLILVERLA